MTGGSEPRRRGRPPGSKNKRAKDLAAFIGQAYGGSAALQAAKLCLVTPAELKAAGGSMAAAQVLKAAELVERVRQVAADRRWTVKFGMVDALAMLAKERAALMPYTDQRQPIALDVTARRDEPSVILVGAEPAKISSGVENIGVFEGVFTEVSQSGSHETQQAFEFSGEPSPGASD